MCHTFYALTRRLGNDATVILTWELLGNDLEPNMGPRFETPHPNLGPQFGTPIWDPNLGPQFGTPIWDPDLGPRFEALWDPELGPQFGTLN
jgi:hypothetical protein